MERGAGVGVVGVQPNVKISDSKRVSLKTSSISKTLSQFRIEKI